MSELIESHSNECASDALSPPQVLIIHAESDLEANAELHRTGPNSPIVLMLLAEATVFASGIGAGQRSAHRTIAGYCLIPSDSGDVKPASLMRAGTDWPQAPVALAALAGNAPARTTARLHGWQPIVCDNWAALADDSMRWARQRLADLQHVGL